MTKLPNSSPDLDPNDAADPDAGLFGLPKDPADAELVVLPVPFDATCSFRRRAQDGPTAVLEASHQVELFDPVAGEPWKRGIHMLEADPRFLEWNTEARRLADGVIERGGRIAGERLLEEALARVNALSRQADALVAELVAAQLAAGKRCVLLGGDHSTALGSIRATAARYPGLGLLHLDAHADLRVAFEGFERSHASALHNALADDIGPELGAAEHIGALVQVGLRDLCPAEFERIADDPRIFAVFDHEWAEARARGTRAPRGIDRARMSCRRARGKGRCVCTCQQPASRERACSSSKHVTLWQSACSRSLRATATRASLGACRGCTACQQQASSERAASEQQAASRNASSGSGTCRRAP